MAGSHTVINFANRKLRTYPTLLNITNNIYTVGKGNFTNDFFKSRISCCLKLAISTLY
nr:MAG TPA: hypothetical protein [Caudoviricetes sp.]